jgi:hypothetical protein
VALFHFFSLFSPPIWPRIWVFFFFWAQDRGFVPPDFSRAKMHNRT